MGVLSDWGVTFPSTPDFPVLGVVGGTGFALTANLLDFDSILDLESLESTLGEATKGLVKARVFEKVEDDWGFLFLSKELESFWPASGL